jgi:twitching motility protein PilT
LAFDHEILETAKAALSASETGHLVLSTMHTSDAQETINRFIDLFHASEHHHVRGALASNLKGVVAQRLLADAHGTRIPACEILINTERISRTIAEPDRGNNDSIRDMIAQDRTFGMTTFDQSLIAMVRTQTITYEVALAASTNPNDLRLELAHDQLDR